MSACLVLCTCPDMTAAQQLATQLVKKKLAACVNLLPQVISVFRWQNQVETANEILLHIKTTSEMYPELESFIQSQHPYEVPEIVAIPIVEGAATYLQWLTAQCQKEERS